MHHALLVQHAGSWPKGDKQPNLTEVDNTITIDRLDEFFDHAGFQLWRIMNDPAIDGAVVNGESTFLHQSLQYPGN